MHVHYRFSYTWIETLNTGQKQAVDDMADRIVEKGVGITSGTAADNKHSDFENNQKDRNHLLHTIRQNKFEAKNILTDIIRPFSDRNKNPLQRPCIASTEFHITGMANPRPPFSGGNPVRADQNINQHYLNPHNQKLIAKFAQT